MKEEKNQDSFSIRPLVLPLLVLVFVALALTVVLTRDKGFTAQELDAAAKVIREKDQPPVFRSGPRQVREATVAGQFYPDSPAELNNLVTRLLESEKPMGLKEARVILVPHAGYIYSAEVAATAFREVDRDFERVFILAANHNSEADFNGVALPEFTHYAIPGVEIPLSGLVDELSKDSLFVREPKAHVNHMIEVELPFLQNMKGLPAEPGYAIIPMILGRMDAVATNRLAAILNQYAGPKTLFVFSVDLSHFYKDSEARQLDMHTINALLSRDQPALARAVTDGNHVLLTMLELARLKHWEPTLMMYRNSGEVSGDRNRVVGYAGMVFHQPFVPDQSAQKDLLALARQTIAGYLEDGRETASARLLEEHPALRIPRGVFVTLKKNGQLRGCIGELVSINPLYRNVQGCAIKAAVHDPRFKPVDRQELDQLSISISILAFPEAIPVNDPSEYLKTLRPGVDGVILTHKGRQSTFLPQVWEQIPEPAEFLSNLCQKQGSPANCWQDKETVLFRYGAYEFGEEEKGGRL